MKKIKYLFLLLVIVLFTGCTVKYDLNVDEDLSVTESVKASEREDTVKTNTGMPSDKAVKYLFNIYKRDGISPSISSRKENGEIIGESSVSHKTIDDYVDNFSSDIFEKATLSKSGSLYTLTFKQTEKLSNTSSIVPIYDNVDVSITLPFKVKDHNADRNYGNTYTWRLKENQELRIIKITFDTAKKNDYFVLNLGLFKVNVRYGMLALIIFLLVISTVIYIVYRNNKKNNKF